MGAIFAQPPRRSGGCQRGGLSAGRAATSARRALHNEAPGGEAAAGLAAGSAEAEFEDSPLIPNAFEIQSLLMELCDETSVAELELKVWPPQLEEQRQSTFSAGWRPPSPLPDGNRDGLWIVSWIPGMTALSGGTLAQDAVSRPLPPLPLPQVGGFKLHVTRDVGKHGRAAAASAALTALPVLGVPMSEAIPARPPPSSAAAAAVGGKPDQYEDDDEDAADEGLLYVSSPKVGVFRRGRFYKGKRGRSMANEGQVVKVGAVVCYIEQLGTSLAIESEHAGEVVKFMFEDGDAVGFGEPLLAIRPSFPGIKGLT
eukprot:SM000177S03163  [mRNA]  locus=s177:83709:85797:+ [translate_table: standard]